MVEATTVTTTETEATGRAVTDAPGATPSHRTVPSRTRLLFAAAASVALALSTTACSDDGAASGPDSVVSTIGVDASTTTSPMVPAAPVAAPADASTVVTAAPAAPPATTAPVDGAAVLGAAVGALAPGYHYRSIVSVGGATAVEVDGDRVGEGTRLAVTRDGATVQYVITPAGTWVMPDGGEWDQLDTPAATADPIAALNAPSAVTVLSASPEVSTMTVAVPAASLGLTGDGAAELTVTVTNGVITSVAYRTVVDGQDASVETAIGPVVDGSEVVPPI